MTLLEIEDLNAYYGQSHVIHDLTMGVRDDEIVALLGRNGAGKTTTMRSIMQSGPRVDGRIDFDGTPIADARPEEIFGLGVSWVPEPQRIFPNLTVEENLRVGLTGESDTEGAFEEVYEMFSRLEERRDQRAGTMSGGERQMLALGRALVSDPKLLLVDEPFEGLMPSLVDDISKTMGELARRDMSMIIAEQRIDLVLEMADRVCVIENGYVRHTGPASEFASNEQLQEAYLGVN